MARICIVIPARYASTRFPGKLLKFIRGKSILQHVYENCLNVKLASKVIIATDHEIIQHHCENNHMDYMMTRDNHISGTDRIAEVISKLDSEFDFVINVQGDEPMLSSNHITSLIQLLLSQNANIATIYKESEATQEFNPNEVKLVTNNQHKVLYFSRSSIPFRRNNEENVKDKLHIGLYGFKPKILNEITQILPSPLEKTEVLEQLRWLENGYEIFAAKVEYNGFGIDTEADYLRAIEAMK